jgi:ubiquinone/menaquinone biosynthesis C-methylase UbiE
MSPPPSSSTTQVQAAKTIYNARSPSYDNAWHSLLASHFVAAASLTPGQCVLDLAAGTGLLTLPSKSAVGPSGTVIAVDVSRGMMEQGQWKVKEQGIEGGSSTALLP